MNYDTDQAPGPLSKSGFKKLAVAAARLADSKKAEDIAVYDVSRRSPLTDFVVVATADNPAHLEAVEEGISAAFKKEGRYAGHRDGTRSQNWRVLDYGGVIVHLFERRARESFAFDGIHSPGGTVKWQAPPPPRKAAAKTAPARRARPGKKPAKKPAVRKKGAAKASRGKKKR